MAQLLARDGWTLGVLDVDRDALEKAVAQLRAAGAAAVTAWTADVADAWTAAYGTLSGYMISEAYGAQAAE